MTPGFHLPDEIRFPADTDALSQTSTRALKNFRYVVGTVNDDALEVWSDLWQELTRGVTPAGMVMPDMEQGFKPSCGWSEFLEKFWLLKHYLDFIHRLSTETTSTP